MLVFLQGSILGKKARAMPLKKTPALIQEWLWPTAPCHYSSELSSCAHIVVLSPHASALWRGYFTPAERNVQVTLVLCSKKVPPDKNKGWVTALSPNTAKYWHHLQLFLKDFQAACLGLLLTILLSWEVISCWPEYPACSQALVKICSPHFAPLE